MLGCWSCAFFATLESWHDDDAASASASALASLCQASAPGAAQAIVYSEVMLSFEQGKDLGRDSTFSRCAAKRFLCVLCHMVLSHESLAACNASFWR